MRGRVCPQWEIKFAKFLHGMERPGGDTWHGKSHRVWACVCFQMGKIIRFYADKHCIKRVEKWWCRRELQVVAPAGERREGILRSGEVETFPTMGKRRSLCSAPLWGPQRFHYVPSGCAQVQWGSGHQPGVGWREDGGSGYCPVGPERCKLQILLCVWDFPCFKIARPCHRQPHLPW